MAFTWQLYAAQNRGLKRMLSGSGPCWCSWHTPPDLQCFTVQPVLEMPPRLKNKPVPDQIIKSVPPLWASGPMGLWVLTSATHMTASCIYWVVWGEVSRTGSAAHLSILVVLPNEKVIRGFRFLQDSLLGPRRRVPGLIPNVPNMIYLWTISITFMSLQIISLQVTLSICFYEMTN